MWQVIQNIPGYKSKSAPIMDETIRADELNSLRKQPVMSVDYT